MHILSCLYIGSRTNKQPSRTPVHQALPALAQEGLLVSAGKRGYSVRAFTTQNSIEAVRIRRKKPYDE